MFGQGGDAATTKALVAFALFVTAIIFGVATISNDNLQDLKTGQQVGATPWRQQVALVLGVIFGALVIPPILDLLNTTFGFQGAPGAGEDALEDIRTIANSRLGKTQRVAELYAIAEMPRSHIGKLLKTDLRELVPVKPR